MGISHRRLVDLSIWRRLLGEGDRPVLSLSRLPTRTLFLNSRARMVKKKKKKKGCEARARQPGLQHLARALSEDPRELPVTLPALFETAEPVRILGETTVPAGSRARAYQGGERRSRGGCCLSRLCSVETRTGTFEGRHLQSQCWRGRRLKHGGPESEENAPSSPRWWSGKDPSGSGAGPTGLLLVLLAIPGRGRVGAGVAPGM